MSYVDNVSDVPFCLKIGNNIFVISIGQYQLGLPVFVSKNESFLMGDPKRVSRNLGSPRKNSPFDWTILITNRQ